MLNKLMKILVIFSAISLLVLAAVFVAEADDEGTSPSYDTQPIRPAYSEGGDAYGGNIVGYQPIPSTALPVVSRGASVGTSQAAPANQYAPQDLYQQYPNNSPATPSLFGSRKQSSYDYTTWLVGSGPYTFGRDDVIQIAVRNQPEFSGTFVVGPDGYIQYNYLGDIPVLGMTKYEVEQVLTKMLEKYVRVPNVNVTIVGYNSKAVYVVGEVGRPGKYLMRGDVIKLREAILAAGLPTRRAASKRTHIIKPDINDPNIRKVDLKRILYKGKLEEDIDIYPGEIIVVPSRVLSIVNDFLSDLLNPVTRAASVAALAAL